MDFLATKSQCEHEVWFFDQPTYHRILAIRCLRRMDAILEPNMCNMTLSVDLGTESLPEDISYSCLFWVDHICANEEDITPVMHHLRDFLFRHLLHWSEAMKIQGHDFPSRPSFGLDISQYFLHAYLPFARIEGCLFLKTFSR